MDWFGEELELVTLRASSLQQIRGGGLPREQKNLALWQSAACDDRRLYTCQAWHDHIHFLISSQGRGSGQGRAAVCRWNPARRGQR